jgi:predicted nucleic acid-binding Zn ribbon protein
VPDQDPADQVSLARAALAAAKADARARGLWPTAPPRRVGGPAGAEGEGADERGAAQRGAASRDATSERPELAGEAAGAAGLEQRSGDGVSGGPVPGLKTGQPTPAGGRRGTRRTAARPGFAAQPQRADPQPLASAISNLLDAEGWALAAATGSVFGRWAQIVGADLAAHTTPESLSDGELTVTADSTAWATQVRLLAAQLVRRLNTELGDGSVRRVKVRGPVTSTRKPGEWRVRGGRGPRDTYG